MIRSSIQIVKEEPFCEIYNFIQAYRQEAIHFWKRCFLKTSVSNGIIYTKYTQNPHTIEPPLTIATQSAT